MSTKEKKAIDFDKEIIDAAVMQLDQRQDAIDYDVKEYTVGFLVQQFNSGDIFIPKYQRNFVWKGPRQSKFVESVLLGLPIPYLFAAEVGGEHEGRLEIIDGSQRIRTLAEFHNNLLQLEGLEELDLLNGFSYANLPGAQRRRFDHRSIRMIAVSTKTSTNVRFEIFERLNTGSVVAEPAEVRKGAFAGPLQDLIAGNIDAPKVRDLADSYGFKKVVRSQELSYRGLTALCPHVCFGIRTSGLGPKMRSDKPFLAINSGNIQ